uniref:Putative secreted protein n=1 Tax=Amblyomma cajennense TaxID=34607 RepID=A0A023FBI6_AMBCJ
MHKTLVVIAVQASFGHRLALLLINLLGKCSQVDSSEILALKQSIEAVLGTQRAFLLLVEYSVHLGGKAAPLNSVGGRMYMATSAPNSTSPHFRNVR